MSNIYKIEHEEGIGPLVKRISEIFSQITGNKLGERQAPMVESRIKKRMMKLGIGSPHEYMSFLKANFKTESEALVGLLTTHHTFFFREFVHFEFLQSRLLELTKAAKERGENTLRIWSAACSFGHEVYSLAMFLSYHLPQMAPGFRYEILGSDIDPEAVRIAKNGVYHKRDINKVPLSFLQNHWVKGTEEISDFVKAKKTLTENCRFEIINLLDLKRSLVTKKFDVIFCRNVFIYFDSEEIRQITEGFLQHLHPTGLLFTGVTEPLGQMQLNIESIGPSVYVPKSLGKILSMSTPTPRPTPIPTSNIVALRPVFPEKEKEKEKKILKVLCVDDSASIISLLKKMLTPDKGLEVVAVAKNGIEAQEMLKKHQVDLMTLDIHMPEMDGPTYLRKNFNPGHPPVVVVSSASREDASIVLKTFELGASDFVEKPSLADFADRAEEIVSKLKMGHIHREARIKNKDRALNTDLDRQFARNFLITRPEEKLRIVVASMGDQQKFVKFFNELPHPQSPTYLLFEGQESFLEAMKSELGRKISFPIELIQGAPNMLKQNTLYLGDLKKVFRSILEMQDKQKQRKTSVLVFGRCSPKGEEFLRRLKNTHLLLEDVGDLNTSLKDLAKDICPSSSFAYLSNKFLAEN